MPVESLADRIETEIERFGPIAVSRYLDAALYDEEAGFYATHGRAGRRGDFLTAPEVGPLFGAVIARALDRWWIELGAPPRFDVVEWGAGPGTLARAVLDAEPEVLAAEALTWHLVERSATQREMHPTHPAVRTVAFGDGLTPVTGVVLANELLDNLPFDVLEWHDGRWWKQLVGPRDRYGRFTLVDDPSGEVPNLGAALDRTPHDGAAVPWQRAASRWLAEAHDLLEVGRIVVFDYGADTATLVERKGAWLRTHRDHDGTLDWLRDPGSCDITSDVAFDQLQRHHPADADRSQAHWLRAHGIEQLVDEGRRIWAASAHLGDLTALKARSRVSEAEALLDETGMGSFRVLEWIHSRD